MNVRKLVGSALFVGFIFTALACKPTPEAACQKASETMNRCTGGKDVWGDKQMSKCVEDTRAAGYEKTVKKCAEMKDCEAAKTCLMIMLVGADKKSKGPATK